MEWIAELRLRLGPFDFPLDFARGFGTNRAGSRAAPVPTRDYRFRISSNAFFRSAK